MCGVLSTRCEVVVSCAAPFSAHANTTCCRFMQTDPNWGNFLYNSGKLPMWMHCLLSVCVCARMSEVMKAKIMNLCVQQTTPSRSSTSAPPKSTRRCEHRKSKTFADLLSTPSSRFLVLLSRTAFRAVLHTHRAWCRCQGPPGHSRRLARGERRHQCVGAVGEVGGDACAWVQLGMLTGDENEIMVNAHVDAALAMGEPFQ